MDYSHIRILSDLLVSQITKVRRGLQVTCDQFTAALQDRFTDEKGDIQWDRIGNIAASSMLSVHPLGFM